MNEMTNDINYIKKDRLRYKTNGLSRLLALLAIVADVFFFISVYKVNDKFFYEILMGASVLYNLLFLLTVFLCSEGVKKYKDGYCYILLVLGVIQILRIFIWPTQAVQPLTGADVGVIAQSQFVRLVIYLVASALASICSALYGLYINNVRRKHIKSIGGEQTLTH